MNPQHCIPQGTNATVASARKTTSKICSYLYKLCPHFSYFFIDFNKRTFTHRRLSFSLPSRFFLPDYVVFSSSGMVKICLFLEG
jgi:hypothetical protein